MKKIILLLFITFSISCKNKELEAEKKFEDSIMQSLETMKLTPKEQFLVDNGFSSKVDLTEGQFTEVKNMIESGLFKDESFCDVYQKSLDIMNNSKNSDADYKKLYSKYKKIDYFETLLPFYGPKLCDAKPLNSTSNNYQINEDSNPCVISEDFIKEDLYVPSSADFSIFDCNTEIIDNKYVILRKVVAENALGQESEYVYKVTLGFKGGNWVDINNWDLIKIQSEEYKK